MKCKNINKMILKKLHKVHKLLHNLILNWNIKKSIIIMKLIKQYIRKIKI